VFRLLRYFGITSLIATVSAFILLGGIYKEIIVSDLININESKHGELAKMLSYSLWPKFKSLVKSSSNLGPDELRNQPAIAELQKEVFELINDLSIFKIKIYNLDGLTIFSTKESEIGEDKSKNISYQNARSGKATTDIIRQDLFAASAKVIEDRDVISSYIPIRDSVSSSRIESVFQIYDDVSPLLEKINRSNTNLIFRISWILGALYASLFCIVRHADGVIRCHNKKIQVAREGLEKRVKVRTAELEKTNQLLEEEIIVRKRSEEQLRITKEIAEEANRSKSDFVANISHELRTPVNGVIGMTNMLLETPLDGIQKEYSQDIYTSARALRSTINDILDLSKIEAGELEIESISCNLRNILEKSIDIVASQANEKGIELGLRYPPELIETYTGDPVKIGQIANNFLSNGIKFCDSGYVIVSVEKIHTSVIEDRIRISVKDSGVGIAKKNLDEIFEKFIQADSSTTRKYGGTGLGLSVCKEISNLMGGNVGVKSQIGEGSTFWVELNLIRNESNSHDGQLGKEIKIENGNNIYLHVVSKSDITRQCLHDLISRWSISNSLYTSGCDAIDAIVGVEDVGDVHHLLISDDELCDMSGFALVETLRKSPSLNNVSVILLVPKNCDFKEYQRLENEINGVITKPVRSSNLRSMIQAIANGNREKTLPRANLETFRSHNSVSTAVLGQYDLNILLVEDHYINQKVSGNILEKYGCTVDIAENGQKAIEMYEKGLYDLIFMDCQMPLMDGYQATNYIRQMKNGKDVPIIALTAHALAEDRNKCLAAGMNDYLSKPFEPEDIEKIIGKYFERRKLGNVLIGSTCTNESTAPFDFEEVLHRCMQDEELAKSLLQEFAEILVEDIKQINDAFESSRYEEMVSVAHKLKGSAGNMAVHEIQKLSEKIEKKAKLSLSDDLSILVDELREAAKYFVAEVREY
jgi:signal transduction histidine kinase/CheY-like chemotaxis protein